MAKPSRILDEVGTKKLINMELDPQFINLLAEQVKAKLYLKANQAAYESKIDKKIIAVLREKDIALATTDKAGEYVFGAYSDAVKKKLFEILQNENIKIISLAREREGQGPINAEIRRQKDFF